MEILILIAKSIGILSLFYVIYISILHKNTLFTANRHFLIAGILAALTLPFLEFTYVTEVVLPLQPSFVPTSFIELPQEVFIPATMVEEVTYIDWWQVALIVYAIGVFIMCIRLCVQLLSLRGLITSGSVVQKGRYTYVTVSKNMTPFSFFSYIVYNPALHTQEELEMILAHEEIHAGQRHSIDILITQIVLALHWCNPLAWLYKQSLEQNLEYIADAHAIQHINNPQQYQRTLVKVSSPSFKPALTNQFYQSFIKKRIVMLNTPQSRKHNLWKLALVLPLLSFFLYSFNVKEVVEYVDEDNSAFAKAEKDTTYANEGRDVFFIDRETTNDKLDRIEKYVTDHWKEVAIKFSKRSYTSENNLSAFTLQVQFNEEAGYVNKLSFNAKDTDQWEGYSFMVNTEREIVIMEQKNGKFINISPLKTFIEDSVLKAPATIEENTTKEEKYTRSQVSYSATPQRSANYKPLTSGSTIKPQSSAKSISTIRTIQDTYNFVITKNSTDQEIKTLAAILKDKHGAILKVDNIKRNRDNQITSIAINFKDSNGNNKNYTLQTPNPINDIYIYRNASGSTGMGNVDMENNPREAYDNRRASLKERRNSMMNTRDSMRVNMAARKQDMRAQAGALKEEMNTRTQSSYETQRRAQIDSVRQHMLSRSDSAKAQRNDRREEMTTRYKNRQKTSGNQKAGYIYHNDNTYYHLQAPDSTKTFYNRWGKLIQKDNALYKDLLKEASFTTDNLTKDEVLSRLPQDDVLTSDLSNKPIMYINGKLLTSGQNKNLNPEDIISISIVKGEKAIERYGQAGKNGVILVKTKD